MTDSTQSKALRMALDLEALDLDDIAAELRRLHAENDELKADIAHKDKFAQQLGRELSAAVLTTAAAVPPEGFVMVPVELANRVQESLGEFLMDHGWSQRDMDTSDDFGAVLLAAAPKAAPAPAYDHGPQAETVEEAARDVGKWLNERPNRPLDLRSVAMLTAYAQAAPAAAAGPSEFPHEQMDAMALARYKVVPSTSSMIWSHAVVAGDGAQQLYVGREVECQNMVRKFAGAFLDGAFAFHSIAAAPTTQAAPQQAAQGPVGSVRYTERRAVVDWYGLTPPSGAKLYTAPQPSPASQGDALDAARYRQLRRGQHWSVINGVGDTLRAEELDAAIDAARSQAKEGA